MLFTRFGQNLRFPIFYNKPPLSWPHLVTPSAAAGLVGEGKGAKVGSGCLWRRRALAIDSHGPMAKWCRGLLEQASHGHGAETGFGGSPLILQSTFSVLK